jgi:hypothetical protein
MRSKDGCGSKSTDTDLTGFYYKCVEKNQKKNQSSPIALRRNAKTMGDCVLPAFVNTELFGVSKRIDDSVVAPEVCPLVPGTWSSIPWSLVAATVSTSHSSWAGSTAVALLAAMAASQSYPEETYICYKEITQNITDRLKKASEIYLGIVSRISLSTLKGKITCLGSRAALLLERQQGFGLWRHPQGEHHHRRHQSWLRTLWHQTGPVIVLGRVNDLPSQTRVF